jgi:hypothetical protein
MSFSAQVFRILIASPSDVSLEREIAVRAIQEWNDLNATERRIVLLPVRWETHSAPEYGKRPQEVINRQVVDHCGLLVGVFWTRVGTPTGHAQSGTIEEIERIAKSNRPVMLYFSQAKQDPDKLDLEQLAKLREFKTKTFPNALVESYSDHVEFKDKLAKQIEIQLRTLLAEQTDVGSLINDLRPITDIVLHFADNKSGKDLGTELSFQTRLLEIQDFDKIPDYLSASQEKSEKKDVSAKDLTLDWISNVQSSNTNKDYYRQRTTYLVMQEFFRPVRFWLKNQGVVGARDVHVQLNLRSTKGPITVLSNSSLPPNPPTPSSGGYGLLSDTYPNSPVEVLNERSSEWDVNIDIPALQPQREVSPVTEFLIGAYESDEVIISARIFADTLSEPIHQEVMLKLEVSKLLVPAMELITKVIKTEELTD